MKGDRKPVLLNLPARLAGLARTVAVIFRREAAAATGIAAAPAATPVAIAIETASAAARTTATTGRAARTRFIHLEDPAADFLPVQAGHRPRRLFIVGHFHKSESAGSPGFPVHGNMNTRHLAEAFEERAQLRFRSLKIHVSDEDILHGDFCLPKWKSAERAASTAGVRSLHGDGEVRMRSRGGSRLQTSGRRRYVPPTPFPIAPTIPDLNLNSVKISCAPREAAVRQGCADIF